MSGFKFYTVSEVAEMLRLHRVTVARQIAAGKLACHRFGDRVLISEAQLSHYVQSSERKARRSRRSESSQADSLNGRASLTREAA